MISRLFHSKTIAAAALAALVTTAAPADDLKILTGGQRIAVKTDDANTTCNSTLYSPSVLFESRPDRSAILFGQGGELMDPCTGKPFMSQHRFGDRIFFYYRHPDGRWSNRETDPEFTGAAAIDRLNFPWMLDGAYLNAHPEAYVGHVASPSVVKVGNRYYMIFTASINDRNLCAGEHLGKTPCGGCANPWSYFVAMWATSDDGISWTVWNQRTPKVRSNEALNAAVLWTLPHEADRVLRTSFKGISRTSMLFATEGEKSYFYIGTGFWGSWRLKGGVVRIPYDPESPWGFSRDPEMWDTKRRVWVRCPLGELPPWFNDTFGRGNVFEKGISNVSVTTRFPGYKYIATAAAHSMTPQSSTSKGVDNIISYRLSNDMVNWTEPVKVSSGLPFFADGKGYDASVIDPQYVEDEGGGYHFFFATADGVSQTDRLRDGRHDCNPIATPGLPTAIFLGLGIYEGGELPAPTAGAKGNGAE